MKIGREGFGEAFGKVLEEATPFARKAAAFGSYPRQLYEGAKQRLGMGDPEAIRAQRMLQEREPGAATAGGVASMVPLSMIPGVGTIAGQTALGGATGLLQPTEAGESVGKNVALSALTAGGLGLGMKGVGMAAKPLLSKAAQKVSETQLARAVRDRTLAEARAAGYVVPKSATGKVGSIEKTVESLAGKGALNQEASTRNQLVTNNIAKSEAGILANEELKESTLAAARDRIMAPYREVAKLSHEAKGYLNQMIEKKNLAKAYWREYEGPNHSVRAMKQAQKNDALWKSAENEIERISGFYGRPDLVDELRSARIALAKNYDVESAFNAGSGNVDAQIIGRILDRRGEKAVTGGLRTIGKFALAFKDFSRETAGQKVAAGISAVKPWAVSAALGLAGYEGHERYGMSPYWTAAAALPLLSGPARNIALSKIMQRAPEYGPGMAAQLTGAATSPLAQKLIPLSAVAAQQEQR